MSNNGVTAVLLVCITVLAALSMVCCSLMR